MLFFPSNQHSGSPYKRWELRVCSAKGHLTYRPTGPETLRLRDRLNTQTTHGEAWRCLRCGDFVLGPPKLSGPLDKVPHIARGKAIRQAFILRLLGAERFLRGVGLVLIAYGIDQFSDNQVNIQHMFDQNFPAIQSAAIGFNYDVNSSAIVSLIHKSLEISGSTLTWVAVGVLIYGLIGITEGVGLWLMKRWGEYFAAVATAAFIPFEIYEVIDHVTNFKIAALVVNIAAFIYLAYSKRLFGFRGGAKAYNQELRSEALLDIELAAGQSVKTPINDR